VVAINCTPEVTVLADSTGQHAVKNGTAGWFCNAYTVNGEIHFARFLGEYK